MNTRPRCPTHSQTKTRPPRGRSVDVAGDTATGRPKRALGSAGGHATTAVDVSWTSRRSIVAETVNRSGPDAGTSAKPSDGLEPSTPSLPLQARSLATWIVLQVGAVGCGGDASRDVASVVSDVSVLCPRPGVWTDNSCCCLPHVRPGRVSSPTDSMSAQRRLGKEQSRQLVSHHEASVRRGVWRRRSASAMIEAPAICQSEGRCAWSTR